ncbi:Nif3-like dinuclear metal center hexameric protein [Glycomyces sp. TRM65418]|uniref:Nif3-like dinuclear metal center hexameric protein n=1 Tax=Glycomyces sp. TRM65418 TaxID=2867006 RepID=UPI001CE6024C|nr:Nif3-like dinuclear metal center hexameric protein [Glycomyces sp. TRM65418]MCC3765450.1 Nif3-like dinuclear metal center hexameric protein [Glycomyces sp. TRM65418]QZD55059.1 Nif3-like dinuclear metal center hexameric protein [Glycomyces sp. TRM65418]
MRTLSEITAALDDLYPRRWAEEWDRVGLVCGRGGNSVRKVLCVVDVVPATVIEAIEADCELIVAHHPLLLRGVSSLDPAADYKGDLVHTLIESGMGLYVAHTNADVAAPGVSDALAERLGLIDLRPLRPLPAPEHHGSGRGIGRVGRLTETLSLAALLERAAKALPATVGGVRAAGDPDRPVDTVAVCGGAGDSYLADAAEAGVDAYLTADLRHHPASEHLSRSGPALIDAAHWATERPWLDIVAEQLSRLVDDVLVSDLDTDPWTIHQKPGVN